MSEDTTKGLLRFGRLRPGDVTEFQRLGISEEILNAAQVRRVTHKQAIDEAGIQYGNKSAKLEGIWFPNRHPETGQSRSGRVRRDFPELEDGRPIHKYVGPPKRHHLYFQPNACPLLADVSVPIVIVEAEKSVLAVACASTEAGRTLLAIGTGGCWGWHGIIGKTTDANGAHVDEKGPLPDFDRLTWSERDSIIVQDANPSPNTRLAGQRLAKELTTRGAKVRLVTVPTEDGINGPDDYIGQHGAAEFVALIDGAKPAESKKARPEKPKQGRDVTFEDPAPWDEPVEGSGLLDGIATTFERYLALPPHASTALALWVLHAHAFKAWFVTPYLAITSPVKRCGKTNLLIVLKAFAPRALLGSNVSAAAVFRAIEKYQPTFLLDEADTYLSNNDELNGVLNSGHTKTTAGVIRLVGEDHEPRQFSTWCPKVIALIKKLPATLADRSIEIQMQRRRAGDHVERLRQDRIENECMDFKRQAARWAAEHLVVLQHDDPAVPPLHDRAADCWRPLLAIADRAGGDWPSRAREACRALSGRLTADDDVSWGLLFDIQKVFAAANDPEAMASAEIVAQLVGMEDRPWSELGRTGRPLSQAKMARLLAPYEIHPGPGRLPGVEKTTRVYRRAPFVDAWERYGAQEDGPEP